MKGVHFSAPGQEYHIYYRDVLWQGSKEYTVLHEAYEIKHETMSEMHSGSQSPRNVCREADRFAAAVLMQPAGFLARAWSWAWTWLPCNGSTATPTPPWPCAWPRWCGDRPCWWSCTSTRNGETRRAGRSRPCCGPGW